MHLRCHEYVTSVTRYAGRAALAHFLASMRRAIHHNAGRDRVGRARAPPTRPERASAEGVESPFRGPARGSRRTGRLCARSGSTLPRAFRKKRARIDRAASPRDAVSMKLIVLACVLVLWPQGYSPSRDPKPFVAAECRWAAFGNNYCQIET